jgi:hypothetical protein
LPATEAAGYASPWAAPPTYAPRWTRRTPATTPCSSSGSSITSRTGGRPRRGRPGAAARGRFFFEEVTATALARASYRALFDHPEEDRFTAGDFLAERGRHGLAVGERWVTQVGGDYLFGVAERRPPEP